MNDRRLVCALFVVVTVFSDGCDTQSTDLGPNHSCVSVGGVWDVTMVGETGTGITCPDRSLVWTLAQNGCDVTLESQAWDPANGATGEVTDDRLHVAWSWFEGCYRYDESIDLVAASDTMTGTHYLIRGQAVYPAYCPGLGICRSALEGVKRAPAVLRSVSSPSRSERRARSGGRHRGRA